MDARLPFGQTRTAMRGEPRQPSRPLWAAPLFVAGVVVLAWVCVVRPFVNSPQRQPARDLALARHLLERGDTDKAESLVRRALEHSEHLTGRIGEATYLLGWAEARRAEQAPPDEAAPIWTEALATLTEAEKLGVPDGDSQKLTYQLGKVGFHVQDDPQRVADRLARSAADADDKAEAYRLLTQAYLHLPQPDFQEALKANEQLRQVAVDDQLAEARLLGGELYLQLQRQDEARKVLERIKPPAAPGLVYKARCLLARSFQEEEHWMEAAALWQSVLADQKDPARQGPILYQLGVCYRQMEQNAEASGVWEQCLAQASGDEGPAAALALADLTLHQNDTEKALALFARAVEKVDTPHAWANSLVSPKRAAETVERAGSLLRQMGQYESALKLAAAYERLAGAAKSNVFRAETWTDWALAGEKQVREAVALPAPRQGDPPGFYERYCNAGAAYLLAASQVSDTPAKANYLWLSTQRFLAGDDRAKAADAFGQLLQLEPRSPHLGEGWYRLGEAHRQAKDGPTAEAAYRESIKYPTVFAYRSRYQLAVYAMERGEGDDAEAALEQNLKLLRFDRDDEAQEKSLFAIGNLCFQRMDYPKAARRLEEALEHFPDNAEAVKARYNLALSYQQMGNQKNFNEIIKSYKNQETIDHFVEENRRMLQRAAEEFEKLMPLLEKPEQPGQLPRDEVLKIQVQAAQIPRDELLQIPLRAAECRFYAGQYAEALVLFDRAADRYAKLPRTPKQTDDYLGALSGSIRCHGLLIGPMNNHRAKLRDRIAEMQLTLKDVDETTQAQLNGWIRDVETELRKRENKGE